ncbi:2-oxoadipate dioxygenase/decarboxylase, chloroplastic/amyloplastic-like [Tasmannia lanceolata]|uniref:2-oxoadipate dioxygenase/decarboxylase, chloroplastic/amyloplastic-like n=1 Tax=Tasmannia lanceolata TaxID=3420 RepID=UPI004063DC7D
MEASWVSTLLPLYYSSLRKQNHLSSLSLSSFPESNSRNFLIPKLKFQPNPIQKQKFQFFSSAFKMDGFSDSPPKITGSFLRSILSSMEKVYLNRNPTAKAILDLVRSCDGDHVCYDHFAFRTFGVDGYGIDSIAQIFMDFGYSTREELRFPAKKLKALWFSPPDTCDSGCGSGVDGPLPRIFISELRVEEMSSEAQEIIRKYTKISGMGNKHAALASALGLLTWEKPLYSDYQKLSRESEYAAWTLVNGYALNHATISTHRLESVRNINTLNNFIEDNGFKLNSEGGSLKVSPDGLLLQSSTVADSMPFHFADGITESVPCSYIEFAERLVLPQYKHLRAKEIKEFHRREGFEVGNADKIFESTSKDQLSRKAL